MPTNDSLELENAMKRVDKLTSELRAGFIEWAFRTPPGQIPDVPDLKQACEAFEALSEQDKQSLLLNLFAMARRVA